MMLSGNALTEVDLHPAGYYSSGATGADDTQQVGYAQMGSYNHCILWSGSAASYVVLTPSTYVRSYCYGTQGGQQIGYADKVFYISTLQHAMLWYGSPSAPVDLHPAQYTFSKGLGIYGGQQVGYGSTYAYPAEETAGTYQSTDKALLWFGTAASVVSLHPVGFDASSALCTNGIRQGGWGYIAASTTSHLHALLWSGNAGSVVDLHPAGWYDTRITAMSNNTQVGDGWTGAPGAAGSHRHALAWSGTAASVVDLNQFLPVGYSEGVATGIDAAGNIVGYAYNTPAYGSQIPVDARAVIFAPGPASPYALSAISLTPQTVFPGDAVQGQVTLAAPAPAGGIAISFVSSNTAMIPAPAAITVAEGQTTATFSLVNNAPATIAAATLVKIFASDGTISQYGTITILPVVKVASVYGGAVQGGYTVNGSVSLTSPAQAGGATVVLTSSNPAVAAVPATITIPQGSISQSFAITTTAVQTATSVPITAAFNGGSATGTTIVNPAPIVALAAVSAGSATGGQTALIVNITLTNAAGAGGASVTLVSDDPAVAGTVAAIPPGYASASFALTTTTVTANTTVHITATYNGTSLVATGTVKPIPIAVITTAEYWSISQILKVQATTSDPTSILTFGTSLSGPALGTLTLELGVYQGSVKGMKTAPAQVVVWSSNGGMPVTSAVTVRAR
jgi:hypothetical protein